MPDVRIYPTPLQAAHAIAEQIVQLSETAIGVRGRFTMALSGGSTPKVLFKLLATSDYAPRIDWGNVHVFWSDERCVPPEHDDSNYHLARFTLLDHVPIPVAQIYRMHGELPPELAAISYERFLREFFSRREGVSVGARFDLVLLGMGADGHTASLFPDSEGLAVSNRWVLAALATPTNKWRLTLTPVAINAAAHIYFFVTGQEKAETLVHALADESRTAEILPVHYIKPNYGEARWYLDQEAARLVPRQE